MDGPFSMLLAQQLIEPMLEHIADADDVAVFAAQVGERDGVRPDPGVFKHS